MKTFNTHYISQYKLEKFIQANHISDSSSLLIQVFTALNNYEQIKEIIQYFENNFSKASLIGSTSDGEISDGRISTGSAIISFTQFSKTTLQTYISNDFNNYYHAGQNVASALIQKNTKALISFIDGLLGNGQEYLDGINSINNQIIVAGGLAGDNATFQNTYVFDKYNVYTNGVVAVALNSDLLEVFTDFSFNWQPIGKTLEITKADKNRVYTIDDKSAVDTYQYYLGQDISCKLPFIGIEFPLIIQKDGFNIARAPISKHDDGSLVFAGNLQNGDKVRFGYGDSDEILSHTQLHIDKLCNKSVETIFMYSCMARRRFIPEDIEHETLVYNMIAPTSGFFTYGEFFSTPKSKELLNQSLTILALSESNYIKKEKILTGIETMRSTTIQALSHLINVSTQELDQAHKQLEALASTDPLTKLYNRRYFTEISEEIFQLCNREKKSVCTLMFDIDNFKHINDTYGHYIGDNVIVTLAHILQNSCRKSDIICRYGGEEFVILLPKTTIDGAIVLGEDIRKKIQAYKLKIENDQLLQFTVSIGASQVNFKEEKNIDGALRRADKALYIAKRNGKNQVVSL